jgi:hypothetical protein
MWDALDGVSQEVNWFTDNHRNGRRLGRLFCDNSKNDGE